MAVAVAPGTTVTAPSLALGRCQSVAAEEERDESEMGDSTAAGCHGKREDGRRREEKDQRARGGQRVGEKPPPSLQSNSIRRSLFTVAFSLASFHSSVLGKDFCYLDNQCAA